MSKSIDQVWVEIQQRRQQERALQRAKEREIFEKRERARREYLEKMKIYENSLVKTKSFNAASAGGTLDRTVNSFVERDYVSDYLE